MRSALARLPPPSFAFVMATGIVAVAAHQQGWDRAALAWFDAGLFGWVALSLLALHRLVRQPGAVLADLRSHSRAPVFFTAVAGTGVLAGGCLALDLSVPAAAVLGLLALLSWFVITYGVLMVLITADPKPSLEQGMGGGWLLMVVACQSVSVAAGLLSGHFEPPWRLQLNFLALCTWLFGGVLYTWLIGLIFYRALFFRFTPADLAPSYWISMGAMAISTLAGAQLVADAPQMPLLQALLPFVKGFTLLFWATGAWWVPLVVGLTLWRYLVRRDTLRAEHIDWSAVFPLGMYSAATWHMALTVDLPFLRPLAATFFWAAVLAWSVTLVAKASVLHAVLRHPAPARHRRA
jgi:tellurite resistance protein TehA-like permease